MTVTVYEEMVQGSEEWLGARRGMLTASVIGQLITPKTVKPASNDHSRALVNELVAERITGTSDPVFVNDDMWRGTECEPLARNLYAEHRNVTVTQVGFIVDNDLRLGYSPDGLVADDGLIEVKAPRAKEHLRTILAGEVPDKHIAQIQAGLAVTGRAWCDFISYFADMPLFVRRVVPDDRWQTAIRDVCTDFQTTVAEMLERFQILTDGLPVCPPAPSLEIRI